MHTYKLTATIDPRRGTVDTCSGGPSGMRKAIALLLFGVCVIGFGCQNVATTWSAEALSPDGRWLALARSQQMGGPGQPMMQLLSL